MYFNWYSISIFSPLIFTICREYNWYYGNAETATGFVNMILALSGFFGQYTIGALLDLNYEKRDNAILDNEGNRLYTVDDYNFAFVVIPICLAILFGCIILLKETH
eukprot:38487_1